MSIMGDNMLFPDFGSTTDTITLDPKKTYTANSDCIVYFKNNFPVYRLFVNGSSLVKDDAGYEFMPGSSIFLKEGSTILNDANSSSFLFYVVPLVKSGGGYKFPIVSFLSYQLNNMVCINNEIKFKKRA
jgi:hypothetical protein